MLKNILSIIVMVAFLVSSVLLITDTGAAAGRPKTVAGLALYQGTDRQKILEEGAKKEGKLIFYTTGILKQAVRPNVKAFQKKYPYIKVQIWRGATSKLVPRVIEEYSAGMHVVDVIEITQAGRMVLQENRILQPFYSPNLAHIEEEMIKKAPRRGAFSAGHYQSGFSLGYNTQLIAEKDLPKTYQDILDPKWKGKIPIAASNTYICWMGAILDTYGEDFVKRLAKQNFVVHTLSGRALLDLIIAGEYSFGVAIFDSHVRKSKSMGAMVDWIPIEPVPSFIGQIMLPKHSAHPHAALLFIDFDLSKQAGEIYKANGYNSPRKDIIVERRYKKHYGPQSSKEVKQWQKLFQNLFVKKQSGL